jgi:hypothetical protein
MSQCGSLGSNILRLRILFAAQLQSLPDVRLRTACSSWAAIRVPGRRFQHCLKPADFAFS